MVAKWRENLYNIFVVSLQHAEIAQLVEHFTRNEGVVGSSPIFSFPGKMRYSFSIMEFRIFCYENKE